MALWQYTFHLLPKEGFDSLDKLCPLISEDGFVDEPYWNFNPLHKSCFFAIDAILEKGISWSKEMDLYGDEDSNCFEVLFDSELNNVLSVYFRSDYNDILREINEFCILNGFIILDEKLTIVPLNFEFINQIIKHAPQVKVYNNLLGNKNTDLSI